VAYFVLVFPTWFVYTSPTPIFAPIQRKHKLWEEHNIMARITVEDCLEKIPSRFELVILASKRAKQLFKGAKPLVETDNREIVTALREVAAGKVRRGKSNV
jgi:DNA-directed RNA polymerase subunit omega